MPELVGVDHRADRLDPSVEYVERQGVEDLAVPVAADRAWLAVHLVRLHHDADPDERRDDRGEHPGHVLGADDPGAYAMVKLNERLEHYDFPVLLAAEWGQADRLLKALDAPGTTQVRKLKVISLLGEMQADEAFPKLKEALQDKNLAQQAAVALGSTGKEAIPILVDMLKNSKDPDLQAAAAKGLGQVGGLNGDATVIPPLLDMLFQPDLDIRARTEVVWAIGKVPDKRAIESLHKLDRSDDPAFKKLKEAAFWSLKMTDTELSSENP